MSDWDDATRINTSAPEPKKPRGEHPYLIVLEGDNVGETYRIDGEAVLGRSEQCGIRLVDDGVSRNHAKISVRDGLVVIEDLGSSNGTFRNGEPVKQAIELADGDKLQIGRTTILKFTYHDDLDESFQRRIMNSAIRDGLTKAYNKRYFVKQFETEFRFSKRHNSQLSLLLLDIDHFKKVNDVHGHLAGDAVLVEFAKAVAASVRAEDIFARYGGEEFAVICRSIDSEHAILFGERLRLIVESLKIVHDGTEIPVTVSIGCANMPNYDANNTADLIEAADKALYASKKNGRNRVTMYSTELD